MVEKDDARGRLRVADECASHVDRRPPRPERQRLDRPRDRTRERLEAQQRKIAGALHLDREVERGPGGQRLRTRAAGCAAEDGGLVDSDRVPPACGECSSPSPGPAAPPETSPARGVSLERKSCSSSASSARGSVTTSASPEHDAAPSALTTLESDGGRLPARGPRDERRAQRHARALGEEHDPEDRAQHGNEGERQAPRRHESSSHRAGSIGAARLILHAAGAHTAPPG